ncbi:MAG TPA: hypothetical protein VFC29_11825 [Candidatus Limnocylindrales bacterium]|nr:hypothetical protein [Candidatus Limnocylindrales bacterium]
MWFNEGSVQQTVQEPSGYTNGGYASGIPSATGNFHARLVIDPGQCDPLHPNNDCAGPYTYWNEIRTSDGTTTGGSNIVTSATANFKAADVGRSVYVNNPATGHLVFPAGTTVSSVSNSTTALASAAAVESSTGAPLRVFSLFSLGYITQADIYLDTAWAAGNPDRRFDWDTAIRDNALNFDSDYAFNVGTQLSGDSTAGFWISTSTNTNRGNTNPENPCPSPANDGIGNVCRAPFKITTSGWYTFRHIFRIDPNTQNLSVELQVMPQGGSPVVDKTIYGWQSHAQAPAGGIMSAYGLFANQEIPQLAIDNALLKDFDALALSPTKSQPIGGGDDSNLHALGQLVRSSRPTYSRTHSGERHVHAGQHRYGLGHRRSQRDAAGQWDVLVRCDGRSHWFGESHRKHRHVCVEHGLAQRDCAGAL